MISSHVVHRLPELWGDDPETFRPERFQEIKPTPFTYLPFSRGVRGCVGSEFAMMHVREIVAQMLGKYAFESLPSAKDRRWKFGYQPFGRDPLRVRLQQRE